MADFVQGVLDLPPKKAIDDDKQLLIAAKKDIEAFGKLYDKYYDAIARYIYHRTLDRTVTEDLTANTFLSAFTHMGRFRWKRISFGAWLYRIATNEVRMYYRKRGKSPTLSIQTDNQADLPVISGLQTTEPSASEKLISDEQYAQLHQAILQIKPTYQAIIILRFFDQKSVPEIAEITGMRQGTIKSQIHRALKHLEAILSEYDVSTSQ